MRERKPPRRLDTDSLWQYALKTLAGRAHSIGELRRRLQSKAERISDVDVTISRLKEYGYLNDQRFAEGFASARLENQQYGKARVAAELRQHRVAPSLAEQVVRKLYKDVDEAKLIEDFIRRKYRSAPRESLFQDEKALASAYRRLLRAGFTSGNSLKVLQRFAADPELVDSFEPPEPDDEETES